MIISQKIPLNHHEITIKPPFSYGFGGFTLFLTHPEPRKAQDTTTELPPERWDMDAYYDADVDAPGGCHGKSMKSHLRCPLNLRN